MKILQQLIYLHFPASGAFFHAAAAQSNIHAIFQQVFSISHIFSDFMPLMPVSHSQLVPRWIVRSITGKVVVNSRFYISKKDLEKGREDMHLALLTPKILMTTSSFLPSQIVEWNCAKPFWHWISAMMVPFWAGAACIPKVHHKSADFYWPSITQNRRSLGAEKLKFNY